MKLPLSRTRAKLVHRTKEFIFDNGGFQSMLDLRTKHQLEDSMGFRGQLDEHRRFQIEMLMDRGLKPHHSFLELGCGPLTAAIPLIQYLDHGRYVGVDIRSTVLDMGWTEIGKAKLSAKNPRLICSTSFGAEEIGDQSFDFVYSFSVLYHLSDEILVNYFRFVSKRLGSGGVCIANVNTDTQSDRWLEFPFLQKSIETYETMARAHALQTKKIGTLADLGFRHIGAMEARNPILEFRRV
ncbi:class I SAM-dependent methyltransferase [Bradyrhizobium sp. 170]|uniref:class I SAM-dependent methyltransferase n=1 Tax=Bradyrhizobium sp. 170 TaxID=2782641 RepID=UPI001FFFBCEF|nr:class I SAM-dependent methyltransferase [Bradyrhizobium sp. 170]UPK02390.1 class I SAM-dependent methyltransferase [Bradyrhizobium sp. 170]